MILVDASIWIDHLHRPEATLVEALGSSHVAQHPMIIGELALGSITDRAVVLDLMNHLPRVQQATHDEVMGFVDERGLYGQGLSLVDAHLLAAVILTPGTWLWTRDKRLRHAAATMGIAYSNA